MPRIELKDIFVRTCMCVVLTHLDESDLMLISMFQYLFQYIHSDLRLQLYVIFKASVKHDDTHDVSISRRHTAAVPPLNFRMRN